MFGVGLHFWSAIWLVRDIAILGALLQMAVTDRGRLRVVSCHRHFALDRS
jgi:predicted Kef-type K+ transport protein